MSESADRIVVVTGGSRGIGRTICTTLSAPGTTVYFNYNSNAEGAEETAAADPLHLLDPCIQRVEKA